jgi:hypothetical protein
MPGAGRPRTGGGCDRDSPPPEAPCGLHARRGHRGLSDFTRRFTTATRVAASTTVASDAGSARLETIKGWRVYGTLVATYHSTSETFTGGPWDGLTRQTFAVRTGPTATDDFVTVTVLVSGRGLTTPVRKSTIIAAF